MMIRSAVAGLFLALSVLVGGAGVTAAFADEQATPQATPLDQGKLSAEEMPVLTGRQWETMRPDSKVAFVWGIGHVVTIEEHVVQRHPELKRQGFLAKLAEGLRGVPMTTIVGDIDAYYQKYPEDLDLPVMRVIWSQLVRPKLRTGIGGQPLSEKGSE